MLFWNFIFRLRNCFWLRFWLLWRQCWLFGLFSKLSKCNFSLVLFRRWRLRGWFRFGRFGLRFWWFLWLWRSSLRHRFWRCRLNRLRWLFWLNRSWSWLFLRFRCGFRLRRPRQLTFFLFFYLNNNLLNRLLIIKFLPRIQSSSNNDHRIVIPLTFHLNESSNLRKILEVALKTFPLNNLRKILNRHLFQLIHPDILYAEYLQITYQRHSGPQWSWPLSDNLTQTRIFR